MEVNLTTMASTEDAQLSLQPTAKKKHHRRAKKARRRNQSGVQQQQQQQEQQEGGERGDIQPQQPEPPEKAVAATEEEQPSQAKRPNFTRKTSRKRNHHNRHQQVYLRPTNGPLLNAPRNSTQFIIDDHENSHMFFNFSQHQQQHQVQPQGDGASAAEAAAVAAAAVAAAAMAAAADPSSPSPDDDTFWAEYSERDFQSVYESAHQEEIAEWDRKKLCDEISALERRQRELVNILARLDPEIYLQKLQSELLSLQEVNRVLKEEHSELNPALPDSSTNEDSVAVAATPLMENEGTAAGEEEGNMPD